MYKIYPFNLGYPITQLSYQFPNVFYANKFNWSNVMVMCVLSSVFLTCVLFIVQHFMYCRKKRYINLIWL